MISPDPQFARSDVLRFFDHIQVYFLLGAAISTLGLLSGVFLLLRRRFDPLLFWFTLFATIYGVHLVMDYQLLWWLGLRPEAFRRIVIALEFLVPLPAFLFFDTMHLLGRPGRIIAAIISPVAICLSLATLIIGPHFRILNHAFLLAALAVFVVALLRSKSDSPDDLLLRRGLILYVACSLYNHLTGIIGHYYHNIEPFGFIVLIVCLGVVAGRRLLAEEQQLGIIQKELKIARHIQLSILPSKFPDSTSFRVAVRYLPMTSVAGDFYDFLLVDDQHAGILVADVSGHGVPAALIASMVKLAAAAQSNNATQPSQLLHGMNASLCGNTQSQFVTAAYVYLSASSGELRYAAAAHPAMLLLRNGEVVSIEENGLMLAAFSFATYTTISHPLLRGDRLLLYTDGLLEAANARGEEFGERRLSALLQETAGLPDSETADRIIETIQQWAVSQSDDLTVLVCDYIA
jgi:sigma-B regulation protein RsbU (phosphoserine phosphatase)